MIILLQVILFNARNPQDHPDVMRFGDIIFIIHIFVIIAIVEIYTQGPKHNIMKIGDFVHMVGEGDIH